MSEMAEVGVIQVPHVRWGGRWSSGLQGLEECEDWQEIAEYAGTTSYQVARALNLGASLPEPPEGKRFEFGSRPDAGGGSTLLVRCVDDD